MLVVLVRVRDKRRAMKHEAYLLKYQSIYCTCITKNKYSPGEVYEKKVLRADNYFCLSFPQMAEQQQSRPYCTLS